MIMNKVVRVDEIGGFIYSEYFSGLKSFRSLNHPYNIYIYNGVKKIAVFRLKMVK